MRRLITILMMLWLPLQVVAGIGVPMCVSPMQAISPLDADMPSSHDGVSHGHHALVGTEAVAPHQAAVDGAGPLHMESTDLQCGDCGMACAAFAVHQMASGTQDVPGQGPAVHGEQCFASAAVNQAFEPPIAAA